MADIWWCWYTIITWINVCLILTNCEVKQYCWPNTFNASCPDGQVILLQSAKYGRMRRGPCLSSDISIGCQADVLSEVDGRCSGRSSCIITFPDEPMHEVSPCPDDMLAYLEAEYDCIKVQPSSASCGYNSPEVLRSTSGYLGSPVRDSSGPSQCSWVIQVQKGQRVNITLFDFSVSQGRRDDTGICLVYAIIQEHSGGTHINVCRGIHRERNVYISEKNEVEVQVFADPETAADAGYFLLNYEAIGCSDPPVPKDAWFKRTDDKVAISCNHSAETWYLYCAGASWIGPRRNCSASQSHISEEQDDDDDDSSIFPYSLLTAVVIGIIMGIVFGIVLLAVVLSCEKRRSRKRRLQEAAGGPKNSVVDYLAEGDISPAMSEDMKAQRFSQYGYTHVWELKNINNPTEENRSNTMKCQQQVGDNPTIEAPPYCEHTYRCREHMYESPRHQIYSTRDGCKTLGGQCYHDLYHQEPEQTVDAPSMIEVDLVRAAAAAT